MPALFRARLVASHCTQRGVEYTVMSKGRAFHERCAEARERESQRVVGGGPRDPAAASRSFGGPDRCDCVNTTPSGGSARQPLDVLNYKSVIHIALLTACGCPGPNGDGASR